VVVKGRKNRRIKRIDRETEFSTVFVQKEVFVNMGTIQKIIPNHKSCTVGQKLFQTKHISEADYKRRSFMTFFVSSKFCKSWDCDKKVACETLTQSKLFFFVLCLSQSVQSKIALLLQDYGFKNHEAAVSAVLSFAYETTQHENPQLKQLFVEIEFSEDESVLMNFKLTKLDQFLKFCFGHLINVRQCR
jgi:hypothetical protein